MPRRPTPSMCSSESCARFTEIGKSPCHEGPLVRVGLSGFVFLAARFASRSQEKRERRSLYFLRSSRIADLAASLPDTPALTTSSISTIELAWYSCEHAKTKRFPQLTVPAKGVQWNYLTVGFPPPFIGS